MSYKEVYLDERTEALLRLASQELGRSEDDLMGSAIESELAAYFKGRTIFQPSSKLKPNETR